ncbi:TM0106 family RecB-like putative nuclease [Leptolyngbya sp. BC1307]|uniref:TM0106 family RecB-like putative nuclease n=1 Tax=Leptolyngbya sp. BC1307 TaxID=2029589 RepID=UPI001F0A1168|nr:TM0106 family RecB-like putative nuclease [Leptolyngbya sp. BC1307]
MVSLSTARRNLSTSVRTTPPATAPMWFTDHMLFHYQRCRRRVYLDSYGDTTLKDPPSDYFVKLREDSAEHRTAMLAQFKPLQRPVFERNNWEAGANATYQMMADGVETIYRGVLTAQGPGDVRYRSEPDVLVKRAGESWLGDWYYVPYNVKLGKKPKPEYQLVAAFAAYVLAEVQGVWPETAWLLLKEKQYAVTLGRYVPKLQDALDDCLEAQSGVLTAANPPEVFISRSRCDMCPWLGHCYQEAKAQNHLSLLPGVTKKRYPTLVEMGITTVEALASAQPSHLAYSLDVEQMVTEKMIFQAQANWTEKAIARLHKSRFPLTPSDVPTTDIELYFDIEAAPDKDLIYLHGVLVVNNRTQEETFHALVAEAPEHEETAWFEFLALVDSYPNAPIYHFCPYEAQTVSRLSELYGDGGVNIDHLLNRFVDIHKRVVEAVALPVESYALKHLARWMGFEWRDEDANGAQSICWYDDWLTTGDRTYLDTILRYNEDDCQATYRVKDWLVKFAQPFWQ